MGVSTITRVEHISLTLGRTYPTSPGCGIENTGRRDEAA